MFYDPVSVAQRWAELQKANQHLHNPQAARMMGVPEAALTASQIGRGAIRLRPEPAALLAPVTQWRRVLVVCASAAGVSILVGAIDACAAENNQLRLLGGHIDCRIDMSRIRRAFWFVNTDDAHGRTRSLQFFDAAGDSVIKLFIPHKRAAAAAQAHFAQFAAADQSAGETAPQRPAQEWPSAAPQTAGAEQEFRAAINALPHYGRPVRITCFGIGAAQTAIEQITDVRDDGRMLHIHQSAIRMHLKPFGVDAVQARRAAGGMLEAVVFLAGAQRAFAIAPQGQGDRQAFAQWAAEHLRAVL